MKKAIAVVKGKKGQHLNEREANAILEKTADGLLLFAVEKSGHKVNLKYHVNGLIPYSDFLKMNNMSRRLLVILLRNIVLILKSVEANHFSKDLLMWSTQSTYIDPSTWRVYMMYVPLQPFDAMGSLKSFLLETVSLCSFESGENVEYVQDLIQEVNGETAYTVGMLESYCDKVSEELWRQKRSNDGKSSCSVCGSKLVAQDVTCPYCGTPAASQTRTHISYNGQSGRQTFSLEGSKAQGKTEEPKSSRGTVSINEDANGVVTVFGGSRCVRQSVWLEDCTCAGKIQIAKFPFRIGKMEGMTDYRIYNNAVSRKHADILKEQGKYYIVDLGSTNGTYLNGRKVQPGVKEVLSDGMFVKFANAEFKIHID